MEAKTAKVSATFERELRDMQATMQTTVREIVKDQLVLLSNRIEQNAKDIRKLLTHPQSTGLQESTGLQALVNKNAENINLLDSNIKTLDQDITEIRSGT